MKRRPSIRRSLLLGLLSAIVLAWLAGVGLVFLEARQEVGKLFNADLARSARVFSSLLRHEVEEERDIAQQVQAASAEVGEAGLRRYPSLIPLLAAYQSNSRDEELDFGREAISELHRYASKLALVARYRDGASMLRTPGSPAFPIGKTGFFEFSDATGLWHGFGLADAATGFLVQVGEQEQVRTSLVDYITVNSLTPFLLVLPLLGVIIWLGVGRAIRPLSRLTDEVTVRVPQSLEPLASSQTPEEVLPLVKALNDLLGRVAMALEHERHFTADAAHELRTPLAALSAHAQVARQQARDPAVIESLDQVLAGAGRTTHLMAQLLTLARADVQHRALPGQTVDLGDCARQVLSHFGQEAVERKIDLNLDADPAVKVSGDVLALGVLLRNLVDNALRYTPAQGHVEVRVFRRSGDALLDVADNGPGLAPAERERVFERFYRGSSVQAPGSGLGLSIVQRIVSLHGAQVLLEQGLDGRGLRVRIVFPG